MESSIMSRLWTITFIVLITVTPAVAQNCDAIIRHGLYNVEITKTAAAAEATRYYNNCGLDFSSMSNEQLTKAEVEVFGYGNGGGEQARKQREENLKSWCVTNEETAKVNQNLYTESKNIYADAVSAWASCNKLKSSDVQIDPLITPDKSRVTMSLRYTGAADSGIRFYGVDAKGFKCDVKGPDVNNAITIMSAATLSTGVLISSRAISVVCDREDPKEESLGGTQHQVFSSGVISVRTASFPFQLFFPEQWTPPLPLEAASKLEKSIESLKDQLSKLDNETYNKTSVNNALAGVQSNLDKLNSRSSCVVHKCPPEEKPPVDWPDNGGGDGLCTCPAGMVIQAGGCSMFSDFPKYRENAPVSTVTWKCGGGGTPKRVTLICCPR